MLDATIGRTLLATLAFALIVTGCAGGGAAPAPQPAAILNPSQVLTITVWNDQLNEVGIWLWMEDRRKRVGHVRANSSETFQVPMSFVTPVHLEFDLTLGERCVTGGIVLGPGDAIEATIPRNLSMIQLVCRRSRQRSRTSSRGVAPT